jgi:hypothetical protein
MPGKTEGKNGKKCCKSEKRNDIGKSAKYNRTGSEVLQTTGKQCPCITDVKDNLIFFHVWACLNTFIPL